MTRRAASMVIAGAVAVAATATFIALRVAPTEPDVVTFGDLMNPASSNPVSPDTRVRFTDEEPYTDSRSIRWDDPGTFTHSLIPRATGTLSQGTESELMRAKTGAEYVGTNSVPKNADIRFTVTGTSFAIRYVTFDRSDAMVWIDDHPVAKKPLTGRDKDGRGSTNWIAIVLPERKKVDVRFAGPVVFSGVEVPEADDVRVTGPHPDFTIGVISDSFYEPSPAPNSMSRSAAPVMTTLTGFRVWNLAEGSTGYLNDGTGPVLDGGIGLESHRTSPFGSVRRLAALKEAPIDALVVNGSINDESWSTADHRAAVDRFLTAVEKMRPDLPIVLVGIEPVTLPRARPGLAARFAGMNRTIKAMAEKHPNVVGFIDPLGEDWLTGSGHVGDPRQDGNQDVFIDRDGVHLNGVGQEFYQGKIVAALRHMPARIKPTS